MFVAGVANFIIIGLIAKNAIGGTPMSAESIMEHFVGNTVVTELPEGTAYDFVQPNGTHIGLHPIHGKIKGSWHIDAKGKTCVTWIYETGSNTNCGKAINKGGDKFKWGDQTLMIEAGDVKNLSQ